jgi:hypothetical protein
VLHGVVQQVDQRPAQVGFFDIDPRIAADLHLQPGRPQE